MLCTALQAVNLVNAGTPLSEFLEVISKRLFQPGDDQCNFERRLRISGGDAFSFVRNELIITLLEVSQSLSVLSPSRREI